MLSYQHIYHAGNLADVQKHALLASAIQYMTAKDKPLTYIETHAGRGVYDLSSEPALKTGEAAAGITMAETANWFTPDHPYARALGATRRTYGATAYPGSPLVAANLLRDSDQMILSELHPQEHQGLLNAMSPYPARIFQQDGFEMAQAQCPPTPRRGLMLIDPSYEIKTDYDLIPGQIAKLHRKWNVGVILLWYPVLTSGVHHPMVFALKQQNLPKLMIHEVKFPPARKGHGMIGSGMAIINTPYGLSDETARLTALFKTL